MKGKEVARQADLKAHIEADWKTAHGIWEKIKSLIGTGGSGPTPTGTGFRHVTSGVEDGAAKLVANADVAAAAAIAESKLALTYPTHNNSQDHAHSNKALLDTYSQAEADLADAVSKKHSNANDPSTGEKAALAGTSGTPGAGNKYVTNSDPRLGPCLQIDENFDGLTTGAIAGQGAYTDCGVWVTDFDGGPNETAEVVVLAGADKCLKLDQIIQAGVRKKICYVQVTNEEGLMAGKIKFSWRVNDVDKSGDAGLQLTDSTGAAFAHLYFQASSSKMISYNGATATQLLTVVDDTWYDMVMIFQSLEGTGGYWHIWINGTYIGRYQMRTATGFIVRLSFFVGNLAHAAEMYLEVNNLKVWNFWRT